MLFLQGLACSLNLAHTPAGMNADLRFNMLNIGSIITGRQLIQHGAGRQLPCIHPLPMPVLTL